METSSIIIAFGIIGIFCVIGVLLCMGKCSFMLGMIRNMEEGEKKTKITRISGVALLVIAVVLAVLVISKI